MNPPTQPPAIEPFTLHPLRPAELVAAPEPDLPWLWHGYLAHTKVTALISPPKAGKTTLLSHLLARAASGGQLAGRAVAPARALIVSEEPNSDWDIRCRNLAIGPHVQFLCRPFRGARPSDEHWFAFIARLADLHRRQPLDLIVIDSLALLLPGYAETCGPKLLDCLLPLQALAADGPAVLLVHHPAKNRRPDGQTARGAGALLGFVDIVMELSCLRRARSRDRRRRICAYSRYPQTPRHLILELNPEGTDYLLGTNAAGVPLVKMRPEVEHILSFGYSKISQQDILDRWPEESDRPDRSTLSRWLKRAVAQNLLRQSGSGHCNDPYLYWLPHREPDLWPGDNAPQEVIQAWRERRNAQDRQLREQPAAR